MKIKKRQVNRYQSSNELFNNLFRAVNESSPARGQKPKIERQFNIVRKRFSSSRHLENMVPRFKSPRNQSPKVVRRDSMMTMDAEYNESTFDEQENRIIKNMRMKDSQNRLIVDRGLLPKKVENPIKEVMSEISESSGLQTSRGSISLEEMQAKSSKSVSENESENNSTFQVTGTMDKTEEEKQPSIKASPAQSQKDLLEAPQFQISNNLSPSTYKLTPKMTPKHTSQPIKLSRRYIDDPSSIVV